MRVLFLEQGQWMCWNWIALAFSICSLLLKKYHFLPIAHKWHSHRIYGHNPSWMATCPFFVPKRNEEVCRDYIFGIYSIYLWSIFNISNMKFLHVLKRIIFEWCWYRLFVGLIWRFLIYLKLLKFINKIVHVLVLIAISIIEKQIKHCIYMLNFGFHITNKHAKVCNVKCMFFRLKLKIHFMLFQNC